MGYIDFDKKQLINLEYSLNRELLRSNRAGSYASTTIVSCNTRKYHGLLVVPQPEIDNDKHVLLSSLDESIIQHDKEFNFGIHKYPGDNYNPKGHKYAREFSAEPVPSNIYRVGGVVLKKDRVFLSNQDCILTRYTLLDAHSPTKLRLKPFLAYRNIHSLSRSNIFVDTKYDLVPGGVKMRMYQGYSSLHFQFSADFEYVHNPDWYYNIEYIREKERGYDYQEDLYVPGFFEMNIKKGQSIIVSVSTKEMSPAALGRIFQNEVKRRIPRTGFENCLINSAEQFLVKKDKQVWIEAGFPWYDRIGRVTFMSVPGLLISRGEYTTARDVLKTAIREMEGPLFPHTGHGKNAVFQSMDAPLWFVWSVQQLVYHGGSPEKYWKEFKSAVYKVLEGFREGAGFNIRMLPNGLIYGGVHGQPLTWMDAYVNGKPVTPRIGCPVEVNSLWYNAVCFALEMSEKYGDKQFLKSWEKDCNQIAVSFKETFWLSNHGYLADYVDGDFRDVSIRPNQLLALSLPFSPLEDTMKMRVLEVVKNELLTPLGIRTLSPRSDQYKGHYSGEPSQRDAALHQGCVFPWLFGHFAEGYLKIYGKSALRLIHETLVNYEKQMTIHGIGSISEFYEGDPPFSPEGAISYAPSVAELLRITRIIKEFQSKELITEKK